MKSFIAATLIALVAARPAVEATWEDVKSTTTTTTTPAATETTWADVTETTPAATETTWADVEETTPAATETKWADVEETTPAATETKWADVSSTTPAAIETTWADAVAPVSSSSVWVEVPAPTATVKAAPIETPSKPAVPAEYTGAASKGAAGAGVIALAGLAMML